MTISFEMSEYAIEEGSGYVTLCVELTDGTVERRVIFSVTSTDSDTVGKPNYMHVFELHNVLNFVAFWPLALSKQYFFFLSYSSSGLHGNY